ncbi:MAG: DUF5689 domain-containing protein [Bacteroidales bacterium]|nr:DUF5689 domain-containing protein [Bacteroidales bacterium]
MKRILTFVSLLLVTGTILLFSCIKDKVDDPPFTTIKFDPDKVVTIGDLKNDFEEAGGPYYIEDDVSLFATVGMAEESGNIYKASFVQDQTGGIQLIFFNAGGLYLGDSIRINLKNAIVSKYHELYQIENIDVGRNIYKIATNKFINPRNVTMNELKGNIGFFQSTVIEMDDCLFTDYVLFENGVLRGETFADSAGEITKNNYFRQCFWDSLIVRTSGYASFANKLLPTGRGKIIAIASVYDSDVQLVIRSYNELNMDQSRCAIGSGGTSIYFEDFNDDWGGWTTISEQGSQEWDRDNLNGPGDSPCAQINGFYMGYYNNTDWLISPEINIEGYTFLSLNFQTAKNFDGDPISVKMKAVDAQSWDDLDLYVTLSEGGFNWTFSSYINVLKFFESPYPEKIQLAFLYTSTNESGSEWRVDNIKIKAN